MTSRHRWTAGLFAAIAGLGAAGLRTASADGLIGGAPLQYGRPYACGGERIVVGRCHHDADDADCQVIYPDRPQRGGFEVITVEPRGDIIRKLQACQTPSPRPAAQPPRPAAASQPIHAPGLGEAAWKVLYLNPRSAVYFTPGSFRRSGAKVQGWFTEIFAEPQNGGPIKGVTISQVLEEGDCAAGTMRPLAGALYATDGRLLGAFSEAGEVIATPPGSINRLEIDLLCGRRAQLDRDEPLEMTVRELQEVYATQLALQHAGRR